MFNEARLNVLRSPSPPPHKCTMKAVVSRLANCVTLASKAILAKYVKNSHAEVCACRRRVLFTRESCVPVTTPSPRRTSTQHGFQHSASNTEEEEYRVYIVN